MTESRYSAKPLKSAAENRIGGKAVFLFPLYLFFFSFFSSSPILGTAPDNYRWVEHNTGLTAGDVESIAISASDPNKLYLATANGVYKSTDGGVNWAAKNSGLPSSPIITWVAVDPNNDEIVYVIADATVYKSTDGGTSWNLSDSGIIFSCGRNGIHGLVIDPSDSSHLLAGSIQSGCSGGVFESNNAGASWTQIAGDAPEGGYLGGMNNNDAWPLAFDPADSSYIVMSTVYPKTFVSIDGGVSWTRIYHPSDYENTDTNGIGFHATSHEAYLATTQGLLKLGPYGSSISGVPAFAGIPLTDVKFSLSDPDIGYIVTYGGSIYKTTDGGSSWNLASSSSYTWDNLAISGNNPSVIFFGSLDGGVFKSTDGGASVSAINNGLSVSSYIYNIEEKNGIFFAAATQGIARSTDGGFTWEIVDSRGTPFFIKISPHDSNTIIASLWSTPYATIMSTDGGDSWTAIYSSSSAIIAFLSYDPVDPLHYLAVVNYTSGGYDLIETTDGGQSWNSVSGLPTGTPTNIAFDLSSTGRVYLTMLGGFYISTDTGRTWTNYTNELNSCSYCNWVDRFFQNPYDPSEIFVGVRTGRIFRSANYGQNWSLVTGIDYYPESIFTTTILFDKNDENTLYASFTSPNYKLWFKSTDDGTSWTTMPLTGLPSNKAPIYIAQDSNDTARIIAGTLGNGIYIYENYIPKFHESTFTAANSNGSSVFYPGDTAVFTFTLKNTGPATGNDTKVKIILPSSGLTYIANSATLDNATIFPDPFSANTLEINAGNLSHNQTVAISFQAKIADDASGTITIDPLVTSDEDTEGTIIPDIQLTITPRPSPGRPTSPYCGNEKPVNAPDLFQIDAADTQATIYFTPAGKPYDYYFISYGHRPSAEQFGTSFYLSNYNGVTSYQINHLSPNTKYYFKVRGGHGCMPGDWSNILEIKTTSSTGKIIKHYRYGKITTLVSFLKNIAESASDPETFPLPTPTEEGQAPPAASPALSPIPNPTPPSLSPSPTTQPAPKQKKRNCFFWNLICW